MEMSWKMEKPKTLKQWQSDGGNIWQVSFTGPKGTPASMASEVKAAIEDYFLDRRICSMSDDRFAKIWNRKLREVEQPFYQMLTGDSEYLEAAQMYKTFSLHRSHSGAHSHEMENTSSSESSGQMSAESSDTRDGSHTSTPRVSTKTAVNSQDRQLNSDMPQSNVSADTKGIDVAVNWTYASVLADHLGKGDTTVTQDGVDTDVDKSSGSGKSSSSSSSSGSGSGSMSESGKDSYEDDETQQGGPVADILGKWKEYLFTEPPALTWLFRQLSSCFYAFDDVTDT